MTEALNIAQVCADRGIAPGGTKGAARHLAGVASGLSRLGHHVTTYSQRRAEGDHPVAVLSLEELGESRPDVVYERYSLSSGAGLSHARSTGARFVLEVNAPLVYEATKHRPDTVDPTAAAREAELLAEADLVIAVSRPLASWVSRNRTKRTVVIPNGFEPAWFPTAAVHREGDSRVAFLGHPKPWHGADRIPELIGRVNQRGHRLNVVVIGGGDGADALLKRGASLGVESQIEVTGPVPPEVASELVATTAIGLAPYPTQEDFYFSPLKVLDYLAAGVPIISTNQGDIAELVGSAGIVIDQPDDDDALANAVVDLLEDPIRRSTLGQAGRDVAFSSRTWDHVALDTARAIHDIHHDVQNPKAGVGSP